MEHVRKTTNCIARFVAFRTCCINNYFVVDDLSRKMNFSLTFCASVNWFGRFDFNCNE